MSNMNEIGKSEDSNKDINILSSNLEDYDFTEENNNPNFNKNGENLLNNIIIDNQQSINFQENPQNEDIQKENNIKSNINTEEEEENNNIIHNNMQEELQDETEEINYEQESKNKNEDNNNINSENNEDEELPLITLNFISVCQCCKKSFDNKTYLPYLLKCGHFFCIKCINEYFTDKNGIKCPSDGLIAKSINELTFLSNLIPKNGSNKNDNTMTSTDVNITNNNTHNNTSLNNNEIIDNIQNSKNNQNNAACYCSIHKDQKLSHVICDSNEIICVYCAFECFKKNPKCEIKELSVHLKDFTSNINDIISNNQNEVLNLHDSLKKIKSNKENEEKAINTFFDCLYDYLNEKKNDYLEQINNLFSNNTKKLGDKLEEVTQNIDEGEKIKNLIEKFLEKGGASDPNFKEGYNDILNQYLKLRQKYKNNKQKMELDEYKFVHIEEDKIVKNFKSLGEIKLLNKKHKFNININDELDNISGNFKKLILKNQNSFNLESKNNEKLGEVYINSLDKQKEQIANITKDEKSMDNNSVLDKNKSEIKSYQNKNNLNYIVLDDSLINNNNSCLNNYNNLLKFDINNDSYNNYYINENNNIFDKKKDFSFINNKNIIFSNDIKKNNFFNNNNNNDAQKKKKVFIHKNTKSLNSFNNYIEFPSYNTNLNNYCLLSKFNSNNNFKKEKERNITVNNYEVHQTLKNSFYNNYSYGHNYSNAGYLNKLFELNNSNLNGYNTNPNNNIKTNRKKLGFLSDFNTYFKNNKNFNGK